MKKFLSLVLALVMTMSLVTISAGAKDFTDDSKITYEEAVDVISAVGVVDGYTDGSFNPTTQLTRGAAAKIICHLILGPTTASALSADAAPFSDVPTTNEFAGYIAYCSQQGIINGYNDGTFRPAAPLTGYAFLKMLLGALGYDGEVEGFTGPNWSIQVGKLALGIGLTKGSNTESRVVPDTLTNVTELGYGSSPDLPDVMAVREALLPAGKREKNLAADLNDLTWFDAIDTPVEDGAVFFAAGVFYYFRTEQVRALCAAMAERFPGGRLVFDAAGQTAVKLMLKTWVRQAGIRDVGAYFSVQDAEKELPAWSDRITVSSRGYMLGYQDLRGPGISNIHRLLARIADGPLKLRIVRMEFQASDSERSTHNSE